MKHFALASLFALGVGCSGVDGTITGPATEVADGAGSPADVDSAPPGPSMSDSTPDSMPIGDSAPPSKEPELVEVKDLAIGELALFQGVKVPLEKDGEKLDVTSKVHVIAGREGVLRVYVTPSATWTSREVVAELTLTGGSSAPKVFTTTKTISGVSDDAILDSTINIDVPNGALETGASYRVRLLTKPGQAGAASRAVYPAMGFDTLDVWETGASFKVVLVPVKSNGRLPDTSPEQLERYRKILQAMYPVRKVELTVRDVFEYSGTLGAGGNGIYGLLDAVTALRKSDGAAKDVYYYGAFAPTSSYSTYCNGGCTTGLCHLPGASDTFLRACVGVGFTGNSSAGTMAHELGHAHGLPHAPCGSVAGADSKYPYAAGKIGSWGYDQRSNAMISPAKSYDFMSYCAPEWISDYAFDKITHRMSFVEKESFVVGGERTTYQLLRQLPSGKLEWGSELTLDEPMFGEPRAVTYVSDSGVRGTVTGYFYPYADEGGSILVPKASLSMREIQIGDTRIARPIP